eukprot:TRINITY_DN2895_c0_g1_i1.p2 TRINITY_DN2895_c0_g1~~TRINITY_DN2895_c0_g1_i1.p2  ORF type:complete len:152 (+),score=35.35 TRINITY_DN2895_c0_g1_i1:64-519(+)
MPEVRKRCPHCDFSWLDKYGKNECPKCIQPLVSEPRGSRGVWDGGNYSSQVVSGRTAGARLQPGEASTFKQSASSAMESHSGQCPRGGAHSWKFGKCSQCGKAEGYANTGSSPVAARRVSKPASPTAMTCREGGKHTFKFAKCVHCGRGEY